MIIIYLNLKSIYEENLQSEELKEILEELNINGFISDYYYIKHDKDINKETGEIKKAHYHIIINYVSDSHKPVEVQARNNPIIKNLYELVKSNINNNIEKVKNVKKMIRYLVHKDNLEKFQYSINEVISNNIELVQDCLESQIKLCDIDIILIELLDRENKEISTKEIYLFFKKYGKLSYCLQYIDKIKNMLKEFSFKIDIE